MAGLELNGTAGQPVLKTVAKNSRGSRANGLAVQLNCLSPMPIKLATWLYFQISTEPWHLRIQRFVAVQIVLVSSGEAQNICLDSVISLVNSQRVQILDHSEVRL